MKGLRILYIALVTALAMGCERPPKRDGGVLLPGNFPFPERLSEWGLFTIGAGRALVSAASVVPYDLNTPLFTDYAGKFRTIWMPSGAQARYSESGPLDFPDGTILSKTFSFNGRRIETRLLLKTDEGWNAIPYLWKEDQSEAELALAGAVVPVDTPRTGRFDYFVPNATQCRGCHIVFLNNKELTPLGPKARHLNRDNVYEGKVENQLTHLARLGLLAGIPADRTTVPRTPVWNDPASASVEARALAYLDVNCSHCHNADGPARTSGLVLGLDAWSSARIYGRLLAGAEPIEKSAERPSARGFCKPPVAAGRGSGNLLYDIVPGNPDTSILVYRLEATDPGEMMPETGRTLAHKEGIALMRAWISPMSGRCE